MKRKQKQFPEKLLKMFDLSHSRYASESNSKGRAPTSELVFHRGGGGGAFRNRITRGKP